MQFRAASEATLALSKLGLNIEVFQLEPGPITIQLGLKPLGEQILMYWSTTKKLLFRGDATRGYVPVGFPTGNIDGMMTKGQTIDDNAVCGANFTNTHTLFTMNAGCELFIPLIPVHLMERTVAHVLDDGDMSVFYGNHAKIIQPEMFERLVNAFLYRWCVAKTDVDGCLGYQLELLLCEACVHSTLSIPRTQPKVREVVDTILSFPAGEPIRAETVVEKCTGSRRSVFRVCTEKLGMSPMDVQRAVQLCRGRRQWLNGKLHSVQDLAFHVGYAKTETLTKHYTQHFGIDPISDKVS